MLASRFILCMTYPCVIREYETTFPPHWQTARFRPWSETALSYRKVVSLNGQEVKDETALIMAAAPPSARLISPPSLA